MAVDSLRDTFHVNRIASEEIGLLLSAQSYRPEITQAISQIKSYKNSQPLQSICSEPISQGQSPTYAEHGHPCLKTRNVLDLIVSSDDLAYITAESAEQLERFSVEYQTILMNRSGAGSIGRVSIYLKKDNPRTNEHLFRIVVEPSFDPAYICCFLSSWWGERAIEQGISGSTGQLNLINEHIRRLEVPILNSKVQKYIGDKVRQAERLREWSKNIQSEIRELLSDFNSLELPKGKTQQTEATELIDSLNPNAYMPRFMEAERIVRNHHHLSIASLCKEKGVVDGPFGSNLKVSDYRVGENGVHPVIRVKNCLNGQLDREDLVWIDSDKQLELSRSIVSEGDVLVTKAGRIGSASVYPSDLPEGNITSHLIRARLKTEFDPYYVVEFLETDVGRAITERHSFKSTRPELTKSEIEICSVALLEDNVMSSVGNLARLRNQLSSFSLRLARTAKLLVESLIENKLTEVELRNAQQSLELGDSTLDRKILARLTPKGIDCPHEPPFFPSLDDLYSALYQLDQETTAEETSTASEVTE